MAKLSKDKTSGNMHPRENLWISGAMTVVNAEVITDADGCASVMFSLSGAFVATAVLEGTVDGTNWIGIPFKPVNVASKLYVLSATAAGFFAASIAGFRQVKLRASAYTSGSMVGVLSPSLAPPDQSLDGAITGNALTATAAVSTAVTLTLPSPGAGLRHYINWLVIERFATALLTAAAAPVIVTTTNLPGALAFNLGAEALPQGELRERKFEWDKPLAASAQNLATTIVVPLITGVITRVSAGWYHAP